MFVSIRRVHHLPQASEYQQHGSQYYDNITLAYERRTITSINERDRSYDGSGQEQEASTSSTSTRDLENRLLEMMPPPPSQNLRRLCEECDLMDPALDKYDMTLDTNPELRRKPELPEFENLEIEDDTLQEPYTYQPQDTILLFDNFPPELKQLSRARSSNAQGQRD